MTSARSRLLSHFIYSDSALRVILIAVVWLAATTGIRPLKLPDEGRYVGVAWEMVTSGNWLVPLLDGMPFFHKPPLFYWITALSLSVFGAYEWAARIASIIAGVMTVGGLYLFIRCYRNSQVATISAVVLASQPLFFAGSQFANLDMLVASMISLTIISGADAILRRESGRPFRLALGRTFALAALGVLAKGLIGIVIPGGVMFVWIVSRKSWRSMQTLFWPSGYVIFAAIALPWFFWMQYSYPGFFDYFVIYHHFQRFSATGFNNQLPFWFYVPVIFICVLPWSPWVWRIFNKPYWKNAEHGALRRLMAIWLVLVVVFFSLPSSKLIGYIFPALPPFAFFIAESFSIWLESEQTVARRWYARMIGLAVGICIALVIGVTVTEKLSAKPLAITAQPVFASGDQLVMVEEYQYDLPFYLRASTPAWIVSDWANPEIPKKDNWQKELFDAGKFDTVAAQSVLISSAQMAEKICGLEAGALWVWGRPGHSLTPPWLKNEPVFGTQDKHALWRFTPGEIKKFSFCAEKPTGG